jgi:hypothetical protein
MVDVVEVATFERTLPHGCGNGSMVGLDRDPGGELESRAVSGEGRIPEQPDQRRSHGQIRPNLSPPRHTR